MTSIRVLTHTHLHHKVPEHVRLTIAEKAVVWFSIALGEGVESIEAFWWHPVLKETSVNMLDLTFEIEQHAALNDATLEEVFELINDILAQEREVPVGTTFGVAVSLPGRSPFFRKGVKEYQSIPE